MKTLFSLLGMVMMLAMVSVSCADDELNGSRYSSQVIENGNMKFSSFIIPYIWEDILEPSDNTTITLIGVQNKLGVHEFVATITNIAADSCEVRIDMPIEVNIPDGKYVMQLKQGEWSARESFVVHFKDNHLCMISASSDPYSSLYDSNTGAYMIKSASDFKKFLQALSQDGNDAKGKTFKQTADIDWNDMKNSLSYGLEHREHFAGVYDGGNHKILNLSFSGSGSSDNVDVGLFRTLKNGAEIKNLILESTNAYAGVKERGGILAGSAYGTVKINNVGIMGTLGTNGYDKTGTNLGGLIGYVKDANLSIEGVNLNITIINAYKHVGGLIGWLENSQLSIQKVYTPNYEINIYADGYIGGFVGVVKNSSFNITKSALNHAGTAQMPDLHLIQIGGQGKAGGVIGSIEALSAASTIEGVDIRVPVGGPQDRSGVHEVGGLVGYTYLSNTLTIRNCFVGVKVEGNTNVGGFIGEVRLNGNDKLKFEGLNVISPQKYSNVEIKGKVHVGGLIGYLQPNKHRFEIGDQTKLITNVVGSGECIGGMIGRCTEGTIKLTNKAIMIQDSMMVVSNTGANTGGFIGHAVKVTIDGQNNFDFHGSIPKFESFTPNVFCTVKGNSYTGGAIGYLSECAIDGLCVKATVTGTDQYTGGLFGYTHFHWDVKILDCTFDGIVTGKANNTGGISGYCRNNGRFQDCINYGQVTGTDNVGGIAGKVDYFEHPPYIYYCVNVGKITGTGDVGGIAGFMDGQQDCSSWTKIHKCGNYGEVYSSGGYHNGAGGILGRCKQRHVEVINCANHGYIHGSAEQVAGIAGWIGRDPSSSVVWYQSNNVHVRYCANFGNIASTYGNAYIGGICGWQEEGNSGDYAHSHLQACYNCGEILTDHDNDTGGILGCADTYVATEDCINFGKVHYGNVAVGTKNGDSMIDVDDIYYLEGTGTTWKVDENKKFTKSDISNWENFNELNWEEHWTMGYSVYSSVLGGQHPVLQVCPFQNVKWE